MQSEFNEEKGKLENEIERLNNMLEKSGFTELQDKEAFKEGANWMGTFNLKVANYLIKEVRLFRESFLALESETHREIDVISEEVDDIELFKNRVIH